MYALIKQAPGASKIILFYEKSRTKKILAEKYQIADNPNVRRSLVDIFGENFGFLMVKCTTWLMPKWYYLGKPKNILMR